MAKLLMTGGKVFTPSLAIEGGAVLIEGSRIAAIGAAGDFAARAHTPNTTVIDARGMLVLPGFVDLQVNGAGGRLFTDAPNGETLSVMAATLARAGCTAFLPTVVSAPLEQMTAAAGAAACAAAEQEPAGARVLGCHLEGPFLNPGRAGAHRADCLRAPDTKALRALLDAGAGSAQLVTLAPELPGATELITLARQRSAVVSLGHTEASAEVVEAAVDAGALIVTHLFNAMPPMRARSPGPAGAALASHRLNAGVIADGVHVHPANLRTAACAMGAGRLVLVTDAMSPVGTNIEDFTLNGRRASARDGACYLADGTLAGSVLTMSTAVRNMQLLAGATSAEAVAMASANPARVLGISGRKGALAPGMDGDVVVCDEAFQVVLTVVEGRVVYRRDGA